jgi:hypothetical protein
MKIWLILILLAWASRSSRGHHRKTIISGSRDVK